MQLSMHLRNWIDKMTLRLQKFIANAGITSRRKAEQMIINGQVSLNGQTVTQLGTIIDPGKDIIKVDGKVVDPSPRRSVVYAFYKPKNCVTTLDDPQGRDTIVKYFPKTEERLFSIGRLDYDSEGLLLLTNDGTIANDIIHPSKHVWKTYFVKVKGKIKSEETMKLKPGPIIDGKKRQPVKIKFLHFVNEKSWLMVSLQEGLKHQLKKMFLSIGYPVEKIKRYSIGNIELNDMKPGEVRLLSKANVQSLLELSKN